MNKPKILLINGDQFGYSSGHYYYCKHLSNEFRINYICFDRGLYKLALESVDVIYVSYSGNKLIRIFRFLKVCLKQSNIVKPNILFITYFNICFLLAVFCKSQTTILDIRTGSLKENIISRNLSNYFIWFQSLFFSRIVILSKSLCKKLHLPNGKSKVVPLGSEIFYPGLHDFKFINLLYVGTLDNRDICKTIKGLNMFLQENKINHSGITYNIVGFGSEDEYLKLMSCILDNNLVDVVKFEGRKTHEELIPYFEKSTIGIVFVPQTPWYNYQPVTKLYEYLLSGIPVIATNTYENNLIVNDKNGILINDTAEDFCEGLSRMYNIIEKFNSSEIRKSVWEYSWDNIVNTNLKPWLKTLSTYGH
jgi:glycosyltransferase involved in cell wall biosynthesis